MTQAKEAERRPIYRGKVVDLGLETLVLPNGQSVELEIVRHPGGAVAAAIDDGGQVCLLRQYRHAANGWLWELPAGKRDLGEPPLVTAQRELGEEAGVEADQWIDLGFLHSSPGILTEIIHLFLATGLRPAAQGHEPHEVIEVHWVPFAEALEWCLDGTITDAKTLIALFRADAWRRRRARIDVDDPGC